MKLTKTILFTRFLILTLSWCFFFVDNTRVASADSESSKQNNWHLFRFPFVVIIYFILPHASKICFFMFLENVWNLELILFGRQITNKSIKAFLRFRFQLTPFKVTFLRIADSFLHGGCSEGSNNKRWSGYTHWGMSQDLIAVLFPKSRTFLIKKTFASRTNNYHCLLSIKGP